MVRNVTCYEVRVGCFVFFISLDACTSLAQFFGKYV
jgi:hypothetical protein